ncbi:MAG: sugar phosphate isomerase/epimerase, partial [Clostridiaceae bacterium]|nr:sugar phosphate isomerase/epimerase [Clostridiaceae bacterium]
MNRSIDMSSPTGINLPIGLQLWSVNEEMEKDFKGTLKKISEIGYDGVEFAGYGGLSSIELKDLLVSLKLKPCGSHVQLSELTDNIDAVIKYSLEIGNKYIICPYAEVTSKEAALVLAAKLNVIGQKCKENGLICGYHNHTNEFKESEGEYALDILYGATDADLVKAEIDTYWVEYAGVNAVDFLKKYSGRFPLIHIKDMKITGDKTESTEVGNGIMNISSIICEAEKQGVTWLIVEQEYFTRPTLESVEIGYNNLKKLIKKGC